MDSLLTALRACAEPTRLRLLALAARGAFCVGEFTEILGQSQPRLSRHLKLLCDAGLLLRMREGANVWFGLPPDAGLLNDLLGRLPEDDPVRRLGEEKIRLLDDLGHSSSKAADDQPEEPRRRIGWNELPSSAPASRPLPRTN